ncbi:type IV secretory system conjugative DNA transfer family protein [Nonomuraea sp. NPDC049400]|uniref:type IV secretory system conjugative DNA transfer family protein n=1 Tax=Nonomuraea sp. NPDC049400 TaxID=3364352 RepID=UPI00379436B2
MLGERSAHTEVVPWIAAGVMLTGVALTGLVWLGGTLGALIGGAGWRPPPFTAHLLLQLADGTQQVWPGVSPIAVWAGIVVTASVGAAVGVPLAQTGYRWLAPAPGLAGLRDLREFTYRGAVRKARRLRPSLRATKHVSPDEAGVLIGDHAGTELRGSWEDVYLAFMGPRSGKTTTIIAQSAIRAPGAAVVTSIRPDALTTTAAPRRARGTLWVFDPQQICHHPQEFWWDILKAARTVEGARRLASHFITTSFSANERGNYWALAAGNLLANLFHAAATSGATVHQVLEWLAHPAEQDPIDALRAAAAVGMAGQLEHTVSLPPETRGGVYDTAAQTVACLLDPEINRWITPTPGKPVFDPTGFVASTDTLYLFSKKGRNGAAPLVAALADTVLQAGIAAAERVGGRTDPPLLVVLDEAANVAPIEDLPDLYSFLGGTGIPVITILQSYQQGVRVWGSPGMDALWSASTVKIIGAGIDDADHAEKISRLVGHHKVIESSVSHSRSGRSVSVSTRKERIYTAADIRAFKKFTGILLLTGIRPVPIVMRPWMGEPFGRRLGAAAARIQQQITDRAVRKKVP